ncbi:MAG: tetratricopeptide repeat protein [Cyanobacteria bacterium]|nr:tetratricopeptide repeat protein [Cyanobacteriota bacterium]
MQQNLRSLQILALTGIYTVAISWIFCYESPQVLAIGTNRESKKYINKGDELFARGGFHAAATYYRKGLEELQEDWTLHLKLGRCLARSGQDKDALKELFHSMILNEKNPEENLLARVEVASLLMRQGNYDEAGGQLKQVLDFHPEDSTVRGNYAICLENLGFLDGAIAEFQTILQANPNDTVAIYNLANAQLQKNQFVKAAKLFKQAAQLDPANMMAHIGLGRAMLGGGNSQGAIELASDLSTSDPDNYLAYLLLGDALDKEGDRERALEAYKKAIKINPKDPACKKALARMLDGSEKLLTKGGTTIQR